MRARSVLVVLGCLLLAFPVVAELRKGSCKTKDDCAVTVYPRRVTSETECYCPMCPTAVMTKAAADANQRSWEQHCGRIRCPMPACARPPTAICGKDGTCKAARDGSAD